MLPDGRVVTGGHGGRVLVWDPAAAGRRPGPSSAATDGGVRAVAVLPDGRVVTGGRRRAGAGVGPGRAGRRPGRARPPRRRGDSGGGAAGRAGGHRRRPTTGGCWCGTRQRRATGPVELGRHEGGVGAVAVLPDGRVVTGGARRAGAGVGPGADAARPGRARPPRRQGGGGGGAAGRAGGHRRRTTGGCWCGTRQSRAPARSSSAATTAGWGRWRCCRTGGWSPAAAARRVLVWDPAEPGAGPVELGRHETRVKAVAVLPDGRVVTGGDDGRVLVWDPAEPGTGPVELGRHDGGWRRWRCCRTGGWSPAGRTDRAGAGVGPGRAGHRPGRARPPRRAG